MQRLEGSWAAESRPAQWQQYTRRRRRQLSSPALGRTARCAACLPLQRHQRQSSILGVVSFPQCVALLAFCWRFFKQEQVPLLPDFFAVVKAGDVWWSGMSSLVKCSLVLMKDRIQLFLLSQSLPISPVKPTRSRLQKCGVHCMMSEFVFSYWLQDSLWI